MTSARRPWFVLATAGTLLAHAGACTSDVVVHEPPQGDARGAGAAGGAGGAGGLGGADGVGCPVAPPDGGAACSGADETCTYGVPECYTIATCRGGAWDLTRAGDCDACPPEPPTGACVDPGRVCHYALGAECSEELVLTCSDAGQWEVTSSPCGFTCPTDDAALPLPCDACCHHPCAYDGPAFCDEWWATCEPDGTWAVVRPIC